MLAHSGCCRVVAMHTPVYTSCYHLSTQDTIRQQDWKIERLMKDNRALEAANCQLRSERDAIKEENLQVGCDLYSCCQAVE
jgi:hypothetical protein